MITFGKKLAELRAKRNLSQRELSELAEIPIGTLRYHEYDKRMMSAADLFTYSKVLGVKCSAFDECVPAKSARKPHDVAAKVKRELKGSNK